MSLIQPDRYLNVISEGPLMVLRVPGSTPWRQVIKAFGAVRREHGLRWKDVFALESASDARDPGSNARLGRAFEGDPECLPAFRLYDWKDGAFVLVREAVRGQAP